MVKLVLVYRAIQPGQFFNEDHYHKVHVARALEFCGKYRCRRMLLARARSDVPERAGRPQTIYRTTELYFDNVDDLRACVYSQEMLELNPDAANYHSTTTEGMVADVEEYEFGPDGRLVRVSGAWEEYFLPMIGLQQ